MFNLSIQHSPGYLLIVVSGTATIAELCASAGFMADVTRRLGYRNVLMDMLSVEMQVEAADAEALASHLDRWVPYIQRLAYVAPAGNSPGILEAVCRSRGVECARFDTLAAAEKWLTRVGQVV